MSNRKEFERRTSLPESFRLKLFSYKIGGGGLKGYLAHEKQPPPLGTPQDPGHRPTIGWGEIISFERGTPVRTGVGRGVWGVGCGVQGVRCRVWGVGRGVWGVGFTFSPEEMGVFAPPSPFFEQV